MKKLLSGLVLSAFLAAPVAAADLPARMPVKAAPMPIAVLYSWTGCYIGGHVGYAWGKKRIDPVGFQVPGVEFDHDIDGFVAGGQVGCNIWQNDRWVLGIEGQASWADLDGSVAAPLVTAGYNGFRTDADIIGSIAGRLGYAFGATGQTLIFVKGGAAFIHEQFFTTGVPANIWNASTDKELRWGWMVGAGIEQALTINWSIKAEYNYSNFGTKDFSLCNNLGCDDFSIKQHVHLVKVGINYRFGGSPVVARY